MLTTTAIIGGSTSDNGPISTGVSAEMRGAEMRGAEMRGAEMRGADAILNDFAALRGVSSGRAITDTSVYTPRCFADLPIGITGHRFNSRIVPSHTEATDIAELVRRSYKGLYPNERIQDAATIQHDIEAGKYILIALKGADGTILGIGGLTNTSGEASALGASGQAYELGKLVVDPNSRKLGLGTKLLAARLQLAEEMGIDLLSSLAVTNHHVSQQALYREGFRMTGIHINDWPTIVENKELSVQPRETTISMMRVSNPDILIHREVFVPQSMIAPLELAYRAVECSRSFNSETSARTTAHAPTNDLMLNESIDGVEETPEIGAKDVHFLVAPHATDTHRLPYRALALIAEGTEFISAKFNISHPNAAQQIQPLLDVGFKFASVMPLPGADILTLQRPKEIPSSLTEIVKVPVEMRETLDQYLAVILNN